MAIDYTQVPDLTESQIAALTGLHDADVSKLIINRDDIKQEKLSVQDKLAAAEQIASDARATAATAKEDALKAANDMDGLKTLYEGQLAEATATEKALTKTAQDALKSRDYGTSESNLLNMFHNDHKEVGEALLSKGLKIGYNSEQQPVTTFEHGGQVVATGIDDIKSWAANSSVFKQYLNGVDSSGADTTRSTTSGGKPMTLTEQAIAANKAI
ncbi:MAG: hypothetical protein COA84_14885 [Robiginitomaculum sp.]|nr:MAG: hypothetical protein COA84_14885 [Robiginitomaculum sp.]